jgi:ssRNA-specific RNase YbeY (16S rRNA maturation enzyme)
MDYIPEVLSFPSAETVTPEGNKFLGDVMICFPLARERAIIENQLLEKSIEELLRHGINNLIAN